MLSLITLAHATLAARALDPTELAQLSNDTAYGDVVEVRTERTQGSLFTVATVQRLDGNGTVDVWLPGGCEDGLCLTVAGSPRVTPGERVFVFLRNGSPTSLAQGLFRVHGGEATRDVRGLSFAAGPAPVPSFPIAVLEALER
jgi:hypothetical protein